MIARSSARNTASKRWNEIVASFAPLDKISAANLRPAHALLESGSTIAKIVPEGF